MDALVKIGQDFYAKLVDAHADLFGYTPDPSAEGKPNRIYYPGVAGAGLGEFLTVAVTNYRESDPDESPNLSFTVTVFYTTEITDAQFTGGGYERMLTLAEKIKRYFRDFTWTNRYVRYAGCEFDFTEAIPTPAHIGFTLAISADTPAIGI